MKSAIHPLPSCKKSQRVRKARQTLLRINPSIQSILQQENRNLGRMVDEVRQLERTSIGPSNVARIPGNVTLVRDINHQELVTMVFHTGLRHASVGSRGCGQVSKINRVG